MDYSRPILFAPLFQGFLALLLAGICLICYRAVKSRPHCGDMALWLACFSFLCGPSLWSAVVVGIEMEILSGASAGILKEARLLSFDIFALYGFLGLAGIFFSTRKEDVGRNTLDRRRLLEKLAAFFRRRPRRPGQKLLQDPTGPATDPSTTNQHLLNDIAELNRTMTALHADNERFLLLLQGIRDYAIFMLSPEGDVSSWNDGASRLLGYKSKEVIGKHFSIFFLEEEIRLEKPKAELVIAKYEGRFEEDGWRVRKDGSRCHANVVITSLHHKDGTLAGYAHVMKDISAREKTENDLREALVKEKDRTSLQRRLLTVLSNELRESLAAVPPSTELPGRRTRKKPETALQQQKQKAPQWVHKIYAIIDNASLHEDLESGKIKISPNPVDLTECCKRVVKEAKWTFPDGPRVEFIQPEKPCLVMADEKFLDRIISNLVSNACKYSQPEYKVFIEIQRHGQNTVLSVKDFGTGIDIEEQDLVFKPFYRAGNAGKMKGAGLGLAVAEHLARLHKGSLKGLSRPGEGSTFTLTLPSSD